MNSYITLLFIFFAFGEVAGQARTVAVPESIAGPGESAILVDLSSSLKTTAAAPATEASQPFVAPVKLTTYALQPIAPPSTDKKLWKFSVMSLIGASAADAASSWGKQESNPLLRSSNGTFGLTGLAVKGGIVGASLIPQYMMRNNPKARKAFAIANLAETGFFSAIALHNLPISAVKGLK